MRGKERSPWPQSTTLVAGVLLLAAGLLDLVNALQATLPITDTMQIPLNGYAVSGPAGAARAAAFIAAAVGIRREVGLAGRSMAGRAALIVWGLRGLSFVAVVTLPSTLLQPTPILAIGMWQAAAVIGGLIGSIAVARARILSNWVRWILLPLALIELALTALALSIGLGTHLSLAIAFALGSLPVRFLEPAALLVVSAALLTWSRREAVKHHARTADDAW